MSMRRFSALSFCLTTVLAVGAPLASVAQPRVSEGFRGGRVEWARLNTGGAHWNRHAMRDQNLLAFLRKHTSLNIETRLAVARPEYLEELCSFPFIFCENLTQVSPDGLQNVAEYIRRGGFLFVDACISSKVNPSRPKFLDAHLATLKTLFPDLRSEVLPANHEVFSIYFKTAEYPPNTRTSNTDERYPLRALFCGDRMIGMLSLSGFQCGWSGIGRPGTGPAVMEMMTNFYVYALSH
jgi:hypothetical protein